MAEDVHVPMVDHYSRLPGLHRARSAQHRTRPRCTWSAARVGEGGLRPRRPGPAGREPSRGAENAPKNFASCHLSVPPGRHQATCETRDPACESSPAVPLGGQPALQESAPVCGAELDHLCPVALIAMIRTETETAEHPEKLRTIHDNATERVHGVLRQSGRYHPAAGLDPERLKGAEKLLVMAADGEAGAGNHAWPPALSDEEITNTRHEIAQYLIEATTAAPAERQ